MGPFAGLDGERSDLSIDRRRFRSAMRTLGAGMAIAAIPLVSTGAQANSAAAAYFRERADRTAVPTLLSQDERGYYQALFGAIRAQDWSRVQTMLAQRHDGPLHAVAQAEYYLAPTSPKIELDTLNRWLAVGRDLPQAEQISALAVKRGATVLPPLPQAQPFARHPSSPKRIRPRDTNDGTMPADVAASLLERIRNDDPVGAHGLLNAVDAGLSAPSRAEWRQKVAWSYYIENQDAAAYALAQTAAEGAGPWVAEGWWTAGLAAWRLGDFAAAADAFSRSAYGAENPELTAAALYWQSRALIRARQPEKAAELLRIAGARDETLYGMLALEQLGVAVPATHADSDFSQTDWQHLRGIGNVRTAVALAEIGEAGLADEVLRHQARTGRAELYQPLSRLARDLGMPSTQLWMAYNAPSGSHPLPAARYPTPKWTPVNGWKVDPALVYAHTLQESVFRTSAVSPAGARGLMQIMPSAAKDRGRELGIAGTASDLNRPEVNLAFGQQHLEMLKVAGGTQGLLPKVMAAYNAGLTPVTRWNHQVRDGGDPLLWMESVPYWETRGYVNIVMRNYWMYERQAGGSSESRIAIAQGLWPTFPGLGAAQGVRLAANGAVLGAR
jgi:soluble lytic murein transglycosylase